MRAGALKPREQGAPVFIPFGRSPDIDLIAVMDDRAIRVQVKTTRCSRNGRWDAMLCTRGGNQSWNGLVKRLDSLRYDYLFVVVADGRRWWIPSAAVEGGTRLRLGGPKYADFEVDPGPPMPEWDF